jgi:4-amino-4-deoxy-L-arabinose transferase-like glycosyltransferase
MLAVVGVWGVPALLQTHGEFLRVGIGKHVLQRSVEPMESHGAPGMTGYLLFLPFYLVTILFSFAPWSVSLPGTLRSAVGIRAALDRYLLLMAGLVFIIFTVIQTKLPHYLLPAFPLLALLVGRHLSPDFPVGRVAGLSTAVYILIATAGFAAIEPAFPSKMIVQRLRPYLRLETRTGSVGYDEQSLVWYLRSVTRPFHQRLRPEGAAPFLAGPGPAVCIFSAPELRGIPLDPRWRTLRYDGVNFARWKAEPASFLGWHLKLPLPQRVSLVAVTNDH